MKETATQRYRRSQEALNRKRVEFYLTKSEKTKLANKLTELRNEA
jgi:hypothetical protein